MFSNVLLIQTAFIGDVVLTTPMIRAIRKMLPKAKLTVLVRPDAAVILEALPMIDELIVIDKKKKHRGIRGMYRLISEVRKLQFDLILSPHMSHRSALIAMFSGCRMRVGYRKAAFSRFAYAVRLERDAAKPEIHRLLDFAGDALAGSTFDSKAIVSAGGDIPSLVETPDSVREAAFLLNDLQVRQPVLIAPSSVWATKRWTPYGFAQLCANLIDEFAADVLLIGSKGDLPVAGDVLNFLEETTPPKYLSRVHNVCGKTSLLGLFSVMKKSRLLISNDSSPVHFACAAGIPVVAIFGPTVPALGYAPIAPRTAVAEKPLGCRPCGTHGSHACPLGHFRCMHLLTAEDVMREVRRVS